MSRSPDTPIVLELPESARLALYFHLVHSLFLLLCLLMPTDLPIRAAAGLLVLLGWSSGRTTAWRGRQRFSRVLWVKNRGWLLEEGGGRVWENPELLGAFCTGWMIIIHFRLGFARRGHVILLPGVQDALQLRRLRLLLRASTKRSDA